MKNMLKNLGTKIIEEWRNEYVLWIFGLSWLLLFRKGYRFLPGAEWLSDIIPLWSVILNLVFLFIFTALLFNKPSLSLVGATITLILVALSWTLVGIGFKRFPHVSVLGGLSVILFNWGWKKWRSKRSRVVSE